MIQKISEMDKGYWLSQLVKQSLKIAAEADQILFLIEKTVEIVKNNAFEQGRTQQAKNILVSMGLSSLTSEIYFRRQT